MASEKNKPCYICWFFTITLAITAGTMLSDAITYGITYFSSTKSSSIGLNGNSSDSTKDNDSVGSENGTTNKELPTVKLSPKDEIPTVKLSPKDPLPKQDMFIDVLPDKNPPKKRVPKEDMPGYKTTLEICNYWKKEYKKEATKQNAAYMEAACNRLKTYQ
jgi:hypothetical protein